MLDWRTLSGCNEPGLRSIGSIKMYQLFSDIYRRTRHYEGERFAGSSDKLSCCQKRSALSSAVPILAHEDLVVNFHKMR
jgi:hypothetical protein